MPGHPEKEQSMLMSSRIKTTLLLLACKAIWSFEIYSRHQEEQKFFLLLNAGSMISKT